MMTTTDFDFGPMMDKEIGQFVVGFISTETGTPKPLASGTLVKCSKAQGILTCGHVVREIRGRSEIGLCVFPGMDVHQDLRVNSSSLTQHAVVFYEGRGMFGPDLAFIPMERPVMSTLEASASVLDLDVQRDRASSGDIPDTEVLDAFAGVIGRLTPKAEQSRGERLLHPAAFVIPGRFGARANSTKFDLLEHEPITEPEFSTPESWAGVSGGGMWRLFLRRTDDQQYELIEKSARWRNVLGNDRRCKKNHWSRSYKRLRDASERDLFTLICRLHLLLQQAVCLSNQPRGSFLE